MPHTLVSLHAHPDDEALLTGGTLARAAAHGHRVVLITATDGAQGLAATEYGQGDHLAAARRAELDAAAAALGVHRVVRLGYGDSGLHGEADGDTLVRTDPGEVAERVAQILTEERADVLTGYDAHGGYGHPDHVQIHHIARQAAQLADTPVLLEATIDRDLLLRGARWAKRLGPQVEGFDPSTFETAYTARCELTHQIDVRGQLYAKRAALRAHASQASGGNDVRTVGALLRLPGPLSSLVLGREWFRQPGLRQPTRRSALIRDVFSTVPPRPRP